MTTSLNGFQTARFDAVEVLLGQTKRLEFTNVDNVDEIQVKSSGFAAEFGGSTGGVINVLTRSGTNVRHGDARLSMSGSALDAGPNPTLRRSPEVSTDAE